MTEKPSSHRVKTVFTTVLLLNTQFTRIYWESLDGSLFIEERTSDLLQSLFQKINLVWQLIYLHIG